ncbi:hypothetical protein C7H09_14210 [Marinobacter fuscus]|uniref:MSHA biogenesis protein MshP n=1 Tax=Marinobacter fuscus TaxID=2109942 RepID=A0A2T1K713_9GAMM|nr:hypothetical protein [Marinobacter fuscus]PSF05543.1 hypothetical protein C7H09_14210 [Marinobacter fuscus]
MYPEFRSTQGQAGAGLPVALFVITVLALLVLTMAQMQQAGGEAVSLQIQSQRAFFAAESGAQLAVHKVLEANDCSAVPASLGFSAAGLNGCGAALDCESVIAPLDGAGGNTVYSLTSRGWCGQGMDRAERTVEVRVR